MNNPFSIENIVLEILKENEEARNDDMKLYLYVCEESCSSNNATNYAEL